MGRARRARLLQQRLKTKQQVPAKARPRLGPMFFILCVLLAAATLAVYWQVNHFSLINTDDRDYVTNNAIVKAGLTKEGFLWAFNVGAAGNWHPLTWLSHMMDAEMFGSDVPHGPSAGKMHLTSLILHVANTLLLFAVLTRMTGYMWRSAFVAALFALHPQHVESVAWVAERKDVLSALFFMLALWGYLWYADRPSLGRYLLVVLPFALGLMAKPMLITLPFLLLLLDFWPLRRLQLARSSRPPGRPQPGLGGIRPLIVEKLPLIALSIASGVLTLKAQSAAGAVFSFQDLPIGARIANALMSYAIYVVKTFWPQRLANYYTHPRGGWPAAEVVGAALLLAAVTYVCIATARRRPYLVVGWAWYVVTLVPVIGILQVGAQARADRYTYIPLIGIFLIVAFVVPELLIRPAREAPGRLSRWKMGAVGAAAVVSLAALSAATYVQVGYWRDGITVARRAIAVTQNNWFEEQSLGSQLQDEAERLVGLGKRDEGLRLAQEAAEHLRKSLRYAPACADARNDYGRVLALMEDYEGAIQEYRRALEVRPDHALARNNLGNTYLATRRFDEAIEQYDHALEIDPRNIFATYNKGVALHTRGDIDAAIRQYLRVLELEPNSYFAYWARYNAAFFLHQKGDTREAARLLREAVRINESTGIDPANKSAKLLDSMAGR